LCSSTVARADKVIVVDTNCVGLVVLSQYIVTCVNTLDVTRAYLLGIADQAVFITETYRLLFWREPDIDGAKWWSESLTAGRLTRAQMVDAFIHSPEYKTRAK
jgi:hypothetical protein